MKKFYTVLFMLCYLFSFAPIGAAAEATGVERRHHHDRHHQKGQHGHNRGGKHGGHHRRPHHGGQHRGHHGHHGKGRHRHLPTDPATLRKFCERHPRPCQRRGIVIPGVIAAATPAPGQEGLVNPAAREVIIDTGLTEHTAITPEEEGYEEAEEDPTASLGKTYFEEEEEEDDDDDDEEDDDENK